ncbi:hypothetical protein TNCV_3716341 [Trichonephila clavipes]|nr:hypothetical protein TNCV_3716341 [Trichonephila clavipes]
MRCDDSGSHLVHGTHVFTSDRRWFERRLYISDISRQMFLPYLQLLPNVIFQQDNARPHGARRSDLPRYTGIQLFPWPERSPDLSLIENIWS